MLAPADHTELAAIRVGHDVLAYPCGQNLLPERGPLRPVRQVQQPIPRHQDEEINVQAVLNGFALRYSLVSDDSAACLLGYPTV